MRDNVVYFEKTMTKAVFYFPVLLGERSSIFTHLLRVMIAKQELADTYFIFVRV